MANNRRTFLIRAAKGLAGASAGLAYLPLAAATTKQLKPLLAVTSNSETYWSLVASQFPFRPGKVPMNAANLCPSPRVVSERVAELTRDEDSDISNPNRSKFSTLAEEARRKVAMHVGVSPEEVA